MSGALLGSVVLLAAATNETSFQPVLPDRTLLPQGRFVYQRNCIVCHGQFGDGRGEMGKELRPRPRNFALGLFKYRSTPPGALPTNEDLERTIRDGLAGTAMPAFNTLSGHELRSVIEYVKSFSNKWRDPRNYAPPLRLPPLPAWFQDTASVNVHAEQGRALFNSACAACHGTDGAGHGTASKDLEDAWGQPATPADLRQPNLRSGRKLEAVYRVLITGIDGTPMPSFAEALTDEQRWELVAFIAELGRDHARQKPRSGG